MVRVKVTVAVDQNGNGKISAAEGASKTQLRRRDADGNGKLEGAELVDIYYKDGSAWRAAGQWQIDVNDVAVVRSTLLSVDLKSGKGSFHIGITPALWRRERGGQMPI